MVATTELVDALAQELAVDSYDDGQENGLQVQGRDTVTKVASAVSVNDEVLEAAISWGADALLTHHGLLWKNQPLHVRGVRRARLSKLLAADLNLLTYHLPLDAHATLGNNAALAEAAGASQSLPAFRMRGQDIGLVAALDAPVAFETWVRDFEATLRNDCDVATGPFHVWAHGPAHVQRIGLLSGAAPHQVQDAIDLGLDAYVTGEVTEPSYHLAKEAGIHFIGAGHYLSERGGVQRLGAWCAQRFDITHRFFDVTTLA